MRTLPLLALALALAALPAAVHAGRPFSTPYGAYAGVVARGDLHNLNANDADVHNVGGAGEVTAATQMDMTSGDGRFGGSAWAYASNADSKMGCQTDVEKFVLPSGGGAGSLAESLVWDTITFDTTQITQPLYIRLGLDGQASGEGWGYGSSASFHLWLYDLDRKTSIIDFDSGDVTSDFSYAGFVLADGTTVGSDKRHFQIGYRLDAYSGIGPAAGVCSTSAGFFHTLRLGMDLPSGLTYSSASGVFAPPLTQAVPEPASMAALAAGTLTLLRRRKR